MEPEALSGSWTYSQDAVLTYQFQIHVGSKSGTSLYVYPICAILHLYISPHVQLPLSSHSTSSEFPASSYRFPTLLKSVLETSFHASLPLSAFIDLLLSSLLLLIRSSISQTKNHNVTPFLRIDWTILPNSQFALHWKTWIPALRISYLTSFSVCSLHDLNMSQFHFYFLQLFLRFLFLLNS